MLYNYPSTINSPSIQLLLICRPLLQRVHFFFLVIVVVESEPEDDSGQDRDHSDTGIHPHDRRVAGGGDQSFGDGGADGGGEQVERLNEGLHAGWGFGVGVFETGDCGVVRFTMYLQ
jgi:hypothetical protein